MVIRSLSC